MDKDRIFRVAVEDTQSFKDEMRRCGIRYAFNSVIPNYMPGMFNYQDVKVTVWVRQKFTIEAASKEEALKEVEKFETEDIGASKDSHLIWDTEWMTETWGTIPVEENGGDATIELYDADSQEMIGDNAVKDFKAKDGQRELIGYQIDFGEDEWPEGLFSFQVFRTKKDAEDFIFLNDMDGKYYDRIVEIYRGDIEEPSFLGSRVREFHKNEVVAVHDGPSWYQAIIEAELHTEDDDETMPVFPIGPDGKCMSPIQVEAGQVYKKAPGKVCPRCGNPLYIEHNDEIDYPLFCPSCDENFYGIEV